MIMVTVNFDLSTFLTFTVLNLVNNYHVVLHILPTYGHFSKFSTLLDFLEIVIFCLYTNFSEHSSRNKFLVHLILRDFGQKI